jgi:CubicO group peptidase (beta-lactamase class C family)
MSKMVTSVAAMHAVDQGLVGLDDDLAEVLPELRDQEVLLSFDSATGVADIKNVKGPITLR